MATAQDVLKVCASQVGIKESPANSNNVKYNTWFYGRNVYGTDYSWCSVYLIWCFNTAGAGDLYPRNAVTTAQDGIVEKCGGSWVMKKNTSASTRKNALKKMRPGDVVTFDFGAMDAWRDHIGIIRSVNVANGTVQCYEGNTSPDDHGSQSNGGMVCLKTRRYKDICACARPKYDSDSKSKNVIKTNTVKTTTKGLPRVEYKIPSRAVDVSAWQGKISVNDWKKVKASGYDIAILRSSYTLQGSFTMLTDKVFVNNIRTAIAAGMKIGIYHYSQAVNKKEAEQEAAYMLKVIAPFKQYINEHVVFDCEFGGRFSASVAKRLGKKGCTDLCIAFCEKVKSAGYKPMVYANYSMLISYLNSDELKKKYKIWLAHYASSTPYKGMYMWQYSSSGSVNGLSGHIDVNKVFDSFKIILLNNPNGKPYNGKLPTSQIYKNHGSANNIIAWQNFLNYLFESHVCDVDGEFGEITKRYTIKFQNAFDLDPDGVVGPKTIGVAKQIKK